MILIQWRLEETYWHIIWECCTLRGVIGVHRPMVWENHPADHKGASDTLQERLAQGLVLHAGQRAHLGAVGSRSAPQAWPEASTPACFSWSRTKQRSRCASRCQGVCSRSTVLNSASASSQACTPDCLSRNPAPMCSCACDAPNHLLPDSWKIGLCVLHCSNC